MRILGTEVGIQYFLPESQEVRGYLQKLIIAYELKTFLKAHVTGRSQADIIIASGGAHIGGLLTLAHVYNDVLKAAALAHYHALINLFTGADEEGSALL